MANQGNYSQRPRNFRCATCGDLNALGVLTFRSESGDTAATKIMPYLCCPTAAQDITFDAVRPRKDSVFAYKALLSHFSPHLSSFYSHSPTVLHYNHSPGVRPFSYSSFPRPYSWIPSIFLIWARLSSCSLLSQEPASHRTG
jgi:hypothetical protein